LKICAKHEVKSRKKSPVFLKLFFVLFEKFNTFHSATVATTLTFFHVWPV